MISPEQAFDIASNIRKDSGGRPYDIDDFRDAMPAFTKDIINDETLERYCDMANKAVQRARWGSLWEEGIRLYVAHFAVLYIQSAPQPGATIDEIINAGRVQGSISSKSVGGVSVSMDNSAAQGDFNGWGTFKMTAYGQQFVSLARMVGKGMMVVR